MIPAPALSVISGAAAVATAAIAVVTDVRSRRIPNALTIPTLALALAFHGVAEGLPGLGRAALGALVVGGILLPGWTMGWMGAGDVKLMAAIGAWLAWPAGLAAMLLSLISGGVLALIVALRRGALARSLRSVATLGAWMATAAGGAPPPPQTGLRFPFAAAIFVGTLASLWIRL